MKYILLFLFAYFQTNAQQKSCFDSARKGTLAEMKSLINETKIDKDTVDDKGSSLLILACYRGNQEVAEFLISIKANLNYESDNGTALMACVVKNNRNLVDLLLKNGANPNLTDANGITALMLAVQFNNTEMVKQLLAANANKELKSKENKTAFELAVFSNKEEIINLLK
jgi:ankyrin repeat protein